MSTLLYYPRPEEDHPEDFIAIRCASLTADAANRITLTLSIKTDYGHHAAEPVVEERSIVIDPRQYADTANEIAYVFCPEAERDMDVQVREIQPHVKSTFDTLAYRERCVARFTVSPDGSDIVLLMSLPCEPLEGFDNIVMSPDSRLSQTGYLCRHSEVFRRVLEKRWKKNNLIRRIDITNSLSFLETACDLLSKVCIPLLEEKPARSPEEERILEMLRLNLNYSVLDVKADEKVREEFTVHKSKLHALKMGYYAG